MMSGRESHRNVEIVCTWHSLADRNRRKSISIVPKTDMAAARHVLHWRTISSIHSTPNAGCHSKNKAAYSSVRQESIKVLG